MSATSSRAPGQGSHRSARVTGQPPAEVRGRRQLLCWDVTGCSHVFVFHISTQILFQLADYLTHVRQGDRFGPKFGQFGTKFEISGTF